jgi:penicillin-binding protein 1A
MTEPLRAGEPLASPSSRQRRDRAREPKPRRRGLARWTGRLMGVLLGLIVLAGAGGGIVAWSAYQKFSAGLPDFEGLRHYQPRVMSRVYAGDGHLLSELATERRIFVPITAIPAVVKQAFISAEDQNFYLHRGVDPLAIVRAAFTDLQQYGQGKRPVGASTITQQVAKNMLLGSNEVTLARKIREAILATRIEQSLSKDRILELYLNEIYLGLQSYGVAAAAQAYFNKSLDELTLPEAAFLAALPKAPNNYNPFRFPDAARARRDWVLDRMAEDRAITPEQFAAAKAAPIDPAAFHRPETIAGADYFAEEVRRQLIDRFGADQTTQGGLVVRTTLDAGLQVAADRALHEGLMRYDQLHGGWRGPVAHIDDGPGLRTGWAEALARNASPPGMLRSWRLGVVIEANNTEAKLGFIEHVPGAPEQQRVLSLSLADIGWARPVHDGKPGPAPKRILDVLQPGDVVMVEPLPATPAQGKVNARPERLALRQIPQVEGALVSLDPATGRVLAMSGGWSYEMSQFNRATQAMRQPGSSFKPYVYLTALEDGISPSQRFLDAPFVQDLGTGGRWRPSDFEQTFIGPVPLRIALEKSLNLVTVRVANRIGMEAVAKTAADLHVVDELPRVLPAALGAAVTTVLRQAGGYAGFATGGKEVIPTLIDSVQDRDGHIVWRAQGMSCEGCGDASQPPELTDERKQVVDAESVYQLVTMMQGVVQRGTGVPAGAGLNRAIAGKTGTSQDFTDAWFAGFTPDLVTVVWVGFDDSTTLGDNETGGHVAAPIWHDFMAFALKDRPNLKFTQPPDITMASWDSGNGTVTDAFKPGQVPGASGPVDSATATADTASDGTPAPHAAGVDSSLGGLY